MIRRVFAVFSFLLLFFSLSAQEKPKKAAMPDLPGSFIIDFGFNRTIGPPDKFAQDFWGSRTLNIYYRYPVRLGASKFSVVPSAGVSLERFKFSNNYTLNRSASPDGSYAMIVANDLYPGTFKSMLVTNYFEIPLGLRFDSKPEDIPSSLNAEIGIRGGVLFQAFTKVKYSENGETKKLFDEQNHGLNSLRYGLYGRFGIGGFNLFTFYNLSPMFQTNKGPGQTTMNTFTFGISVNGF